MSNQAEIGFLGIILNNSKLLDDYDLQPEEFIVPQNRMVYQAILNMREKDQPITCATFMDFIEQTTPDDLNLFNNSVKIMNEYITDSGIDSYAQAIRRDAQGHILGNTLTELAEVAHGFGSYQEKYEKVLDTITALQEPDSKELVDIKIHLETFVDDLERRQNSQGLDGLSTGFTKLDERFNGLKKTDLIIIAGRPSQGKTTLALNIAENIALQDKSVLVFSLEMSASQLITKSVASISGLELNKIKQTEPLDEDSYVKLGTGIGRLKETNLTIDESARSVHQMTTIAKKRKIRTGLDLVVVDYIQLGEGKGNSPHERIGSITQGLKRLAKELDVPVIALSQLSREVEKRPNKRPQMSDLRDSGSIEADADIVMFVYRDEYYYPEETMNKGVAEIITSKFRMGEVGKDFLSARLEKSKFVDFEDYGYAAHENNKKNKHFDL